MSKKTTIIVIDKYDVTVTAKSNQLRRSNGVVHNA